MTTLEKILQDIDSATDKWGMIDYINDKPVIEKEKAKEIIKKHMTDDDGWIPAEKRMPENAKYKGKFCPKYQIMTSYGVTEGWYNPDRAGWYGLFWFIADSFIESYIDMKRGDIPKTIFIPDGGKAKVIAWRLMPEPYRKDGE